MFFLHKFAVLLFLCSTCLVVSALIDIDVMDVIVVSISNWVYLFLQAFLCKNMQLRGFDWLVYIFLKLNVIHVFIYGISGLFLARDVIYTSRTYAKMSVSVCL